MDYISHEISLNDDNYAEVFEGFSGSLFNYNSA